MSIPEEPGGGGSPGRGSRSGAGALLAILALALGLRLLRVLLRWDEVSWLYAAYPGATLEALVEGRLLAALTTWSGLHPPLWPLLHSLQELVLPVPLGFLLLSAACSFGAVLLLWRRSPWAGLVLATSPVQLHYAAEVNDYPLAVLLLALAWCLRSGAARPDAPRWLPLGLALLALAWTHALGAAAGLFVLWGLARGVVLRVLGLLVLGCLPLLPGLLAAVQDPDSYRQPPLEAALVLADLQARFGWLGLLWLVPAALGARALPAAALALGGTVVLLGGFVFLGVAAPHQFPYLLLLGPPLALLVEAGSRGHRGPVLALALVQGAWVGAFDLVRLGGVAEDLQAGGRAVDLAWAESAALAAVDTPVGAASPALLLLSPAGTNDDDKRATSAVLWRLRPWWSMPPVLRSDAPYADHRLGQPRAVRGRVVYLDDHVRPELSEYLSRHPAAWVVVSEPGRRAEYTSRVQELLGVAPEIVGGDHLYRLRTAHTPAGGEGAAATGD